MDVREKLVELLDDMQRSGTGYFGSAIENKKIADYLIKHGVTVQEWIPVTERLPEIPDGWTENHEPVLYMMKNTKTIYAGYYGEDGWWRDKYFREYADSRNGVDADDVLCWIYQHDLPKPLKGDADNG